jgi:hypothetical protein
MTADDTTATTPAQTAPEGTGRPQRRRKAQAPRKTLLLAGETVNAGTLAAMIGDKPGAHEWALGRKVNDKRVRSLARDVIERLSAENRTGYTAHAYTQGEADAIVAAMATAGRGAPTANANALRARATGKASA